MKLQVLFLAIFLIGLATVVPVANAETIKGKVESVDLKGDQFKMFAEDPKTGEKKNLEINVTRGTKLEGINSILELKVGDYILIDAQATKNGEIWKATSVKVSASEISAESPQPFAEEKPAESWTEKSEPSITPMEDEEVTPTNKKTNRTP